MTEAGETFSCPKCGGPLTADGKNLTVTCPFCGASVIVPASLRPKQATSAVDILREAARSAAEASSLHQPSRQTGKSSLIRVFALLAAGVIVLTGLSFLINLGTQPGGNPVSQVVGLVATPTVTGFQKPISAGLPRQVNYAGIVFTLTGAEIDNQDQNFDPPVNRSDQAFARLSVGLQNTTRENIFLDPALFKLHLADGNDYALDANTILRQDFRAPGPQASGSTLLVFPVPPQADWDGSSLVIGAPGSEPAAIPLSGEMPAAAYPLALQLPGNPQASAQGLDYLIQSAALDLDQGAHRADQDRRFLILDLQITNASQQYGANVSNSNFRLILDGISSEPQAAPIEVIYYQTTLSGQVVFQLPAGATSAILQVGNVTADSNDFGKITLDLTHTKPVTR